MSTSKVVHELTSATLRPFVESNSIVLLAVLMLPQSRQCQTFVPVFRSVSDGVILYPQSDHGFQDAFADKILKIAEASAETPIVFGQINVTGNWDAVSSFEINTFPHIMLFQGFDYYKTYKGAFAKKSIMSYLDRYLQFPVITTIGIDTLSTFKSSCDVVVVGYTDLEDHTSTAHFESLATAMHPELVFGVTDNTALAEAEGVNTPVLVVYNNAAHERRALPITSDTDQLKANLRKAALPLMVELYTEIHDNLLDMGTPFAYIFTEPDSIMIKGFHAKLEQLARKNRQKIQFSIAAASDVESIVLDMHLQPSHLPTFAIREPSSNMRYPMLQSTTASLPEFITEVTAFTEDYLALKLQPTIKSEPTPPASPSALVKVVGQTYASIVNNSTRDVLLVFCIEVCAPCDRLYPTLEALAETFRAEESQKEKTTVATVLHDKNDTGLRRVRAFPTIMLFPARDKGRPVRFLGDRTVEALTDFISANRSL